MSYENVTETQFCNLIVTVIVNLPATVGFKVNVELLALQKKPLVGQLVICNPLVLSTKVNVRAPHQLVPSALPQTELIVSGIKLLIKMLVDAPPTTPIIETDEINAYKGGVVNIEV